MIKLNDEQFEQAEFIVEWQNEDLNYKAFYIPRDTLDEGVIDEDGDIYIVGLDSANVRRFEKMFDPLYSRMSKNDESELLALMQSSLGE